MCGNQIPQSLHPGSAILGWWAATEKDEHGYGRFSELVEALSKSTKIRGPEFFKAAMQPDWFDIHGWQLVLHRWRPNRVSVKIQPSLAIGSPTYVENSDAKTGEASS